MVASGDISNRSMLWGRFKLPKDAPFSFRLGPLGLDIVMEEGEIRVRTAPGGSMDSTAGMPSSTESWTRWAAAREAGEVELLPALPDRPLVLRPEHPFHLLPGARARIYVRVPVWVVLRVPGTSGGSLMEIPSLVLSDTWWGDFESGELCYWLHIVARRSASSSIFSPDRIICPVELVNRSGEELPVEKILLRCEHLSVFRGAESLWSDETRVGYRGEEIGSDLEMTGRTPPEAPKATRVATPRVPVVKGLTARTFARLRGIPGLGGTI